MWGLCLDNFANVKWDDWVVKVACLWENVRLHKFVQKVSCMHNLLRKTAFDISICPRTACKANKCSAAGTGDLGVLTTHETTSMELATFQRSDALAPPGSVGQASSRTRRPRRGSLAGFFFVLY